LNEPLLRLLLAQQNGELETARSAKELASLVMTINLGLRGQSRQKKSRKELKSIVENSLSILDKLIQPLAKGQDNEPNMKHKLALWMSRQLPSDHPLLL